jgi:hypothetical protein
MLTTVVSVSLYPEMIAVIPQENSKHPIGKAIRQYYERTGQKVWKDMAIFSTHDSIPKRLRKYISKGSDLGGVPGEGQIEGQLNPLAICNAMEEEGWQMIAIVEVTEARIELYFGR